MAKNLGWRRRGWYYVSGVRCQEFEAAAILNSTGQYGFTMAGRIQLDFGWSWTFWIVRVTVTVHEGEVASLTSQTLTRAIFSLSVWPSRCLNFDRGPFPSHGTLWKEIYQIRAFDFGVQFSFNSPPGRDYVSTKIGTWLTFFGEWERARAGFKPTMAVRSQPNRQGVSCRFYRRVDRRFDPCRMQVRSRSFLFSKKVKNLLSFLKGSRLDTSKV